MQEHALGAQMCDIFCFLGFFEYLKYLLLCEACGGVLSFNYFNSGEELRGVVLYYT